ncbi:UDP-N-acetylmuramoyl-tripeptide--D-alanyl-D-alanine ligase [Bacillus horti]|uniref:UDP-N-acetylmuramoyl-tripeptide--D-alanyl-D-alanine ligase n=1 Tax=Caldalkalibacillus horti TaxID=77523 RepID=A0ABT9VY26_9BACI|nr:UDP-N-acetylmuramoyl-tripeptide--D-alanyl-D-alanine ligase [Bacillus horti]MDQ0165886.1 UDP-N-acetylmuramoyl-tripeptide--D-alanyl-D-alanine ligase [Bacillus horti]
MIQRSLLQIQEMLQGSGLLEIQYSFNITGVSIDTRTLKPQNLYVPIKGERFNGHHFLDKAIEQGATATLWSINEPKPNVQDFPVIYVQDTLLALQQLAHEYRKQLKTKVIGITGSNGKTSTKDILAAMLSKKYRTQKTKGNLNNHIGVPLTLLELKEDTEMAVVEMGMSAKGEIEKLAKMAALDVAILTNIGEGHLDTLHSKENILQAKLEIVTGLKEDGLVVFNGDDPYLQHGLGKRGALPHTIESKTFGMKSAHSIYPTAFVTEERGVFFTINDLNSPRIFLPMLGKHQMINALGALVVAKHFNVSYAHIQKGLNHMEVTGMRNEWIQLDDFTILSDCYKSDPMSIRASLDILYGVKGFTSKIVVLGDTGQYDVSLHEKLGKELSTQHIDYVLTVGSLAKHIAKTAATRFSQGHVIFCADQDELLFEIKKVISKGSIILVKGSRGNQLEHTVSKLMELSLQKVS